MPEPIHAPVSTEPSSLNLGTVSFPADLQRETLGIAFIDLSRIQEWKSPEDDERIATFLQSFYHLSAERIERTGGRIVKLMGDEVLLLFPKEKAEGAILTLVELTHEVRSLGREHLIDVYLNVNIHVGPVLTGTFGPPGSERFDVMGKTVNVAARLGRRGITLSPQAFRCLDKDARERFEKIMPPITYRFRR